MHETERTKLLHGPYRVPRCKVGRQLRCAIRGKVVVRFISDAPMMWPCTWRNQMDRRPSLILCGDLVKAIRVESAAAIKHHFGVSGNMVWQWRKALGVDRVNVGTSALMSRNAPGIWKNVPCEAVGGIPKLHDV